MHNSGTIDLVISFYQRKNILSGCLTNRLYYYHFLYRFRYSIQVTRFMRYNSTANMVVTSVKKENGIYAAYVGDIQEESR